MSTKRSTSRSPKKSEKRRVKINDDAQVLLFERQYPTNSPQDNPYHKDKPSPETHQEEMNRKIREARAINNRYANSAEIKDKRAYRRDMLRKLASQLPTEERIMIPRRDRSYAVSMVQKSEPGQRKNSIPVPQSQRGFLVRMFNRAKSTVASKKKGGKKTIKRRNH